MIRISFIDDRVEGDYLAELEYVDYLKRNGASVAGVIRSSKGRLMEKLVCDGNIYVISVFEKAPGMQLADNGYQYRPGAPLSEYFYNSGKTLGKMHQLSKSYEPANKRYDFFDRFTPEHIDRTVPDDMPELKAKLCALLDELSEVEKNRENYGMVHFDYSDGNYMIDYDTGDITVYDFDNACTMWYMYDLANLWEHGVGWIQFEPDAEKRRQYMDEYFSKVLEGYRSETDVDDEMIDKLPLFLRVVLMEGILDEYEVQINEGEDPETDEEQAYRVKCMLQDIPYFGFFDPIYSVNAPFTCTFPISFSHCS